MSVQMKKIDKRYLNVDQRNYILNGVKGEEGYLRTGYWQEARAITIKLEEMGVIKESERLITTVIAYKFGVVRQRTIDKNKKAYEKVEFDFKNPFDMTYQFIVHNPNDFMAIFKDLYSIHKKASAIELHRTGEHYTSERLKKQYINQKKLNKLESTYI